MKCIICQGDDIRVRDVREQVDLADDVVYVPLTIPVCSTCGERYYDRRTVRYLEDVEQELKAGTAKLRDVGRVRVYG